jgi:ribonuclease Z
MRPIFQADLINGPFGDPGLLVDLKFERRALMFDLGDLAALPTRKMLRLTDVFVSHAHMDHFAGFDRLLRVCLGRDTGVRLYGPPGFIEQVEHKLAAYTWNLVDNYEAEFVVRVDEVRPDWRVRRARFGSRARFRREDLEAADAPGGLLLEDPLFRVRALFLDHGIPSLAFRFEEGVHINVWKNRLEEMQLPTGPWLTELRARVREGAPDSTPIAVRWRDRDGSRERVYSLGELRAQVLELVPGQIVCYVTDAAWTGENARRIAGFASGADTLYIEAVFLDEDRDHASRKMHLTARQAGGLARVAGVRSAIPFHLSPRYMQREQEIRQEFEAAWRGAPAGSAAGPPAPEDEQGVSGSHAAEVREVRDALAGARDAKVQLEHAVQRDEYPGRHRDRREQQHDPALRIGHAEREQQPEHAAGGAYGRQWRQVHVAGDHQLRDRGADHADEVILQEVRRPEQPLDLAAEHVQREHVEQQVRQAAVHESVGEQLPDLERRCVRELRRSSGPQRERTDQQVPGEELQAEHRYVDDQQCPGDGREAIHDRAIVAEIRDPRPGDRASLPARVR